MPRVYNFSAGPGTLPEEVLLQAADEMLDWHGTGQSVMEMSHRGKEFISIAEQAEADLDRKQDEHRDDAPAAERVMTMRRGGTAAQIADDRGGPANEAPEARRRATDEAPDQPENQQPEHRQPGGDMDFDPFVLSRPPEQAEE